ncbi:hypothetical protein [Kitasatospora sp. NPDC059827]|uniref:hypothetical protein n=1 Tax=Kitasatospora sp. NPDC059827 TaxID=3346964 RepID=UPI00365EEB1E
MAILAGAGGATVAVARDFAGYPGLALDRLEGGRLATAATAVFPFLCVSFDLAHNRPGVWAWPLHGTGSVTAATQALALLAAGALSLVVPPPRRYADAELIHSIIAASDVSVELYQLHGFSLRPPYLTVGPAVASFNPWR